jgi:hypothetical protein
MLPQYYRVSIRRRAGDLTSVVCTRFSDADKEWLERAAREQDLTASDLVRAAVKYYRRREAEPRLADAPSTP